MLTALRPDHFCQLSRAGEEGGPFVLVRRDQGQPEIVLGVLPAHRRPPSGAGGKHSCVDGTLRTWAGEGEPVFSKVRFLVLWSVAVWGMLDRGTP